MLREHKPFHGRPYPLAIEHLLFHSLRKMLPDRFARLGKLHIEISKPRVVLPNLSGKVPVDLADRALIGEVAHRAVGPFPECVAGHLAFFLPRIARARTLPVTSSENAV